MALRTFTNTRYFSEAALDFKKNKGVYTRAPKGSKDYVEYWKEQKRRCLEGYTVGDLSITGRHYWYLNFFPIKRTPPRESNIKKKNSRRTSRADWNVMRPKASDIQFPGFWEIDYNWWWAKEIAMYGATKEEVQKLQIDGLPIKDYTEGKHLSCLKTRRAGFSYKEAADGLYNYNFIPKSKSYYFAAKSGYLDEDGILNKVTDGLNHLNTNTQGFWRKNRMVKDTMFHRKASYIDKNKDEKGYMSEIIGVIINDPDKVRGKDGIKIVYEEAGSFKNLKRALAISVPSVRSGASMTGQISVFGTGGEEGEDIEGLEDIFTSPDVYDMLAFYNIWDTDMEDTVCGYFVPCYMANESFMDMDGNVDIAAAIEYDDKEREKKKQDPDPKQLDMRIAEFPRTPSEALNRIANNIFPVAAAQARLRMVEKNADIQSAILHGEIFPGKRKIEFRPLPREEAKPVLEYPHKNGDDLSGAVTIYQAPERGADGKVKAGKYITVVDPYYKDEAEDRTSLWVTYVIKLKAKGDPYGNRIVASYIGRPPSRTTCYENTTYLALMYNTKIQCEIAGGGQGLFDYLRTKKMIHLACYEPSLFTTKELGVNEKNRNFFMNLSTDEKRNGIMYVADWLREIVGISEEGLPIRVIDTINDVGLLREIIKYDPNPKKNFDRISALIVAMYQMKEELMNKTEETEVDNEFYNRMFSKTASHTINMNDTIGLDDLVAME